MEPYADFDASLQAYREAGGYMLHEPPHHLEGDTKHSWWVGDYDTIASIIFVPDRTPEDTTRHALEAGGLSEAQIKELMST